MKNHGLREKTPAHGRGKGWLNPEETPMDGEGWAAGIGIAPTQFAVEDAPAARNGHKKTGSEAG